MRLLERMHPAVCFAYMLAVIGVTVVTRHPVLLAESAAGALILAALSGKGGISGWALPIAAVTALTNPLFSHNGVTVLFFVGDTAFTAEAFAYGALFGIMLAAVCVWGACGTVYVGSDKYIWLFGRIFPSAGLTLSCALRFVPLFIRRTAEFAKVRRASSVREYLSAFSSSVSYSAEEAIGAADSMKARGYGTARRTSYSPYRMGASELAALAAVLLCSAAVIALLICGAGEFYCYPALSRVKAAPDNIAVYALFGALCAVPSAVVLYESARRAAALGGYRKRGEKSV